MAPQLTLQSQLNLKLMETGQREKLLNHLIEALHVSGWYEQTRHTASRAVIDQQNATNTQGTAANADGESISDFHQVLQKVQEDSWPKIPTDVQKDMYQQIAKVLHQLLK